MPAYAKPGRPRTTKWAQLRKRVAGLKRPGAFVTVRLSLYGANSTQLRNIVQAFNRKVDPAPPRGCRLAVHKGAGDDDTFYVVAEKV